LSVPRIVILPDVPGPEKTIPADRAPRLIGEIVLEYPAAARRAGLAGVVLLRLSIDEAGRVSDAAVIQTPHKLLSKAAMKSIEGIRFEPALRQGVAVAADVKLPLRFELE